MQKLLWARLAGLVAFGIVAVDGAEAQVIPDATLGAENSRVRRATVRGREADLIEGGATRGQNLFHSFREFGIREGDAAYFANPAAIQNIFGRVTGSNPSNILGTLGVDGAANLFLINPNGILFGPNASLDLGGSFTATTASAIQFGEQQFSATDPAVPSRLLSVSPSAFFFNQLSTGSIVSRAAGDSGLQVPNGERLTLLGGNVAVRSGELNAWGGRIDVGAVAGEGTVGLAANGRLLFPADLLRADVLFNNARLDVSLDNGGDISITGDWIDIENRSRIIAGIDSESGTIRSQAGDVLLNGNIVQIRQTSLINNTVNRNYSGNAGDVKISSNSISFGGGSQAIASTSGRGNVGNVVIDAEQVSFDDANAVSAVGRTGRGRGGNVTITADSLSLTNGAGLAASTFGRGDAGNVVIDAEQVSFDDANAFSVVGETGRGRGGNVTITADSLSVTNGAGLVASTFGRGDAGDVVIDAQQVSFDDAIASSNVGETGRGRGGNVTVTAGSLSVTNGAQLNVSTFGQGRAGNVMIDAEQVSFDDAIASSAVGETGRGRGGTVTVAADFLSVTNGAVLNASTFGQGRAGDVVIDAQQVSFDDATASSSRGETGRGRGGNVTITAGSLSVTNGAQLNVSTFGQGRAGNVVIDAQQVSFDDADAFSRVEAAGRGRGGNVTVTADFLSVTNGTQFTASTFGRGDAGNVAIEAGQISFDDSNAFSTVEETGRGRGGNVIVTANSLSLSNGAQLTASTRGRGDAGNVVVEAGQVSFEESDAFSQVAETGRGRGGNVTITADSLSLSNGAQLAASTLGRGDAGNVVIEAGQVSFDGTNADGFSSGALSTVAETGRGRGGNVTITADSLSLSNGARLNASTLGRGDAGNVVIEAGQVSFEESDAFSQVAETGRGRGGNVIVTADSLSLSNGAQLTASTFGRGRAGNVVIEAGRTTLDGTNADGFRSGLFTTATSTATGQSGDITITGNGLRLLNGSTIRTDDQRTGRVRGGGGNIQIDTNYVLATEGSDILAFSGGGSGGNINLPLFFSEGDVRVGQTRLNRNQQIQLLLNDRIDIDASGSVSPGGVNVVTPDTGVIQNSLADLPANALDTENLLANSCIARSETGGTFLITGTGGLPTDRPDTQPPSPYPTDTVRTEPDAGWQPGDPIVEPQGVYQLPNGELILSHDCR